MPTQSSLGAGVLQTAMRLSLCIGLSASTAVFGSVSSTPEGKNDATLPFERAYLSSGVFAVVGLLCVPFMRIGIQGGKTATQIGKDRNESEVQNKYERGGEWSIDAKTETIKFDSGATHDGRVSCFPRWSWESEREWVTALPVAKKPRDSNAMYDVCILCLSEPRAVADVAHSSLSASF
jgi:hypothetical protein